MRTIVRDPVLDDPEDEGGGFRRRPFFRVLRTSAFRYIIFAAGLFVFAVLILGYVVYESTIGAAYDRIEAELEQELDRLELVSLNNGAPDQKAISAVINEAETNKIAGNSAFMVWIDDGSFAGPVSGNLEGAPAEILRVLLDGADDAFEFDWRRDRPIFSPEPPKERRYLGVSRTLIYDRGSQGPPLRIMILLARDVDALHSLRQTRREILFRVVGVTLLLAVGLGAVLGTAMVRRLDGINKTVAAITEGDLTRRLPVTGALDEYDILTRNINTMLDQIEQLMSGMRQVSDNIAHDLRSPLTRIKARLDAVLRDEEFEDEQAREVLSKTRDETERLLQTFNALLSITRIEAGSRFSDTVDLKAVAEEMLELYIPAADEDGVEMVAELQETPLILGSRELISQAIANLLDNALKYARHPEERGIKPKIELTVAPRPGGGALLSVIDNGPGVSELDRERITKRFVRLEQSRSTGGNGLGLSLVTAIVRRHAGRMSVGTGLPHEERSRSLTPSSAYGLGIRIAFPPIKSNTALAKSEALKANPPRG
jgi:signal transduction histidine kinase